MPTKPGVRPTKRRAPRAAAPQRTAAVNRAAESQVAGVSSAAVQRATGKGWDEWFTILDGAGAAKMTHKDIAAYLHAALGVGDWWSQMVTVGYEQARGRREKHQKPDGYSVSGSKTIGVPLQQLFAAWHDPKLRARWLADSKFTVRKATATKSMRITWVDGRSSVDANFYAKGADRSQVAVEHSKLASAAAGTRMKRYWSKALEELKSLLEE